MREQRCASAAWVSMAASQESATRRNGGLSNALRRRAGARLGRMRHGTDRAGSTPDDGFLIDDPVRPTTTRPTTTRLSAADRGARVADVQGSGSGAPSAGSVPGPIMACLTLASVSGRCSAGGPPSAPGASVWTNGCATPRWSGLVRKAMPDCQPRLPSTVRLSHCHSKHGRHHHGERVRESLVDHVDLLVYRGNAAPLDARLAAGLGLCAMRGSRWATAWSHGTGNGMTERLSSSVLLGWNRC